MPREWASLLYKLPHAQQQQRAIISSHVIYNSSIHQQYHVLVKYRWTIHYPILNLTAPSNTPNYPILNKFPHAQQQQRAIISSHVIYNSSIHQQYHVLVKYRWTIHYPILNLTAPSNTPNYPILNKFPHAQQQQRAIISSHVIYNSSIHQQYHVLVKYRWTIHYPILNLTAPSNTPNYPILNKFPHAQQQQRAIISSHVIYNSSIHQQYHVLVKYRWTIHYPILNLTAPSNTPNYPILNKFPHAQQQQRAIISSHVIYNSSIHQQYHVLVKYRWTIHYPILNLTAPSNTPNYPILNRAPHGTIQHLN